MIQIIFMTAVWMLGTSGEKEKLAVIPTVMNHQASLEVSTLFDDYLMTAVQENTSYKVLGMDDVNAMLGFEQHKDMLQCEDASCLVEIGNALNVARIMRVNLARIEKDWIVTGKIINIREAHVEQRKNDIITGDVKVLLKNIPSFVQQLFGLSPVPSTVTTAREDHDDAMEPSGLIFRNQSYQATPQNFTMGERVGTFFLNALIPGLGSFVIMGDVIGGVTQCVLLGGGTGLLIGGIVRDDPVLGVPGVILIVSYPIFNIVRSIVHDKPLDVASLNDFGFNIAMLPDKNGEFLTHVSFSKRF